MRLKCHGLHARDDHFQFGLIFTFKNNQTEIL